MEKNPEFDDIRPYYDEEVVSVIERLLENPLFKKGVQFMLPEMDWEELCSLMRTFTTKQNFQHGLIKELVYKTVSKTASGIECKGFENISPQATYTYISNHRDIILDASILSSMLGLNGHDTVEIAIGDNLLLNPWIEDLVRLNKSFIVKRGVSFREQLEASKHLSRYIHFAIKEKKESVWIAQREGRAKNSDDRTQESLLKMLAMGSDNGFLKSIEELNIAPVSFSYEYDPCDYLKAKEFQQKRDNPEFKKSAEDDLISMETGLLGYKGNIHIQFGHPINSQLSSIDSNLDKNESVARVAALIDKEIFLNYQFYPVNYIAYDRLWGKDFFSESYTSDNINAFDTYLQQQLDKIDLPDKDIPFLTEKMLEMYAYPVKNQLAAKEEI
jgi:hypothetical protein